MAVAVAVAVAAPRNKPSAPRPDVMAREKQLSFDRRLARSVPLIAVVLGMTVVFASVVLYFGQATTRVVVVSVGMLLLVAGAWFADNPYLKSQRRYLKLRAEVDGFIALARELNAAADPRVSQELKRVNVAMHESVDRMAQLAGKPDTGSL